MPDTPDHDLTARALAENLYAAYAQQASGPIHPQQEQTLLARLAEAIAPAARSGSGERAREAANAALDAWEEAEPAIRGPRAERLDFDNASVTLVRPT